MNEDTATVKVRVQTRETLRAMAAQQGSTMQDLLERLVEDRWAQQLFEQIDEGYAIVRSDDAAWTEEREERDAWDAALPDEPLAAAGKKPAIA